MGIRFAKTIKLGKYVKINLSKSGVSATIGKKGASINLGSKGTYLNVSPTAVGIKGTGVSYRQKITGGYGNLLGGLINKVQGNKEEKQDEVKQIEGANILDTTVIDEYNEIVETNTSLFKLADNVKTQEELEKHIEEFDSDASKEIYKLALSGDEDTVESLVGAYLNNLNLNFEVKANYELEDTTLYVDLDLPEIENFEDEYPTIVNNEIVYKKKTTTSLKEEYGKTVLGLGIYLTANFFNITSYIKEIVISAFTTRRDSNGDLKDEYLYSVKYTRDIFEQTDLSTLTDAYEFMLKFENRINMSNTYVFKPIKPYEMASVEKANGLIDDAIAGLKELGYKAQDINEILPSLNELKLETSGEYLKEALKLLKK